MKFCTKCGNKLSDSMKFCNKCGAKVKSVDKDTKNNSDTEDTKDKKIFLTLKIILIKP